MKRNYLVAGLISVVLICAVLLCFNNRMFSEVTGNSDSHNSFVSTDEKSTLNNKINNKEDENKDTSFFLDGNFIDITHQSLGAEVTFESCIAVSSHCVIGEFVKFTVVNDSLWEYEFKVKERIYGNDEDEIIRIRVEVYDTGVEGNLKKDTFKTDHNYILILHRDNTIFLNYPRYSFIEYIVMDTANLHNSYWQYGSLIIVGDSSLNAVKNKILENSQKTGLLVFEEINMFRTEDEETVIKNCDLILKVKPKSITSQGVYEEMTVYKCEVIESLKGEYNVNSRNYLFVRTTRNALEKGTEYIIPLSRKRSNVTYDQASPICIFDAEDIEMEIKIKEWLSEKNVP